MGTLRSSAWPAGLGVALGVALGLAVAQLGRDTTRALDDAAGIQRQYAPVLALDGTAKQEILAIARLLQHQPGVWYYNDGARVEPFHGRTLGHPMLVLGVAAR